MTTTNDEVRIEANVEKLELYSDNSPFKLSMRIDSFESEAEFKKFIKNVEKLVRASLEYKAWKDYIIDVLGVDTCAITAERIDECSLEVHHHVPSLYAVVKAVISKHLEKEEKFSSFDIALEVMQIHFQNKIGYIAIIKSLHEKFHNGYLDIPVELIKGDWKGFLKEYIGYLDESEVETIQSRLAVNKSNCEWSRNNYKSELDKVG